MKGQHIYLRACEPTDLDSLYTWENDPEIRAAGEQLTPFSRHTLQNYLASAHDIYSQGQLRLMVCLNLDHRAIGTVDLTDFDSRHGRAGVGILIDAGFRQRGYAREAMQLLMRYARETLGLRMLHCATHAENTASRALFTHIGFEECGHRKQWYLNAHGPSDEILMQYLFTN